MLIFKIANLSRRFKLLLSLCRGRCLSVPGCICAKIVSRHIDSCTCSNMHGCTCQCGRILTNQHTHTDIYTHIHTRALLCESMHTHTHTHTKTQHNTHTYKHYHAHVYTHRSRQDIRLRLSTQTHTRTQHTYVGRRSTLRRSSRHTREIVAKEAPHSRRSGDAFVSVPAPYSRSGESALPVGHELLAPLPNEKHPVFGRPVLVGLGRTVYGPCPRRNQHALLVVFIHVYMYTYTLARQL
jgi:hypothetical protein